MTRNVVLGTAGLVAAALWVMLWVTAPQGQPPVGLARGSGAPSAADQGAAVKKESGSPAAASSCVDVNTADIPSLTRLPGIGPALAGRIIEHRNRSGRFTRADDLLAVPGIGPSRLKKMHDLVCF